MLPVLNCKHPSAKLARWALIIQELDLEIHYRPGRQNSNADALSRNPPLSLPVTDTTSSTGDTDEVSPTLCNGHICE